MPTSCLFDVDLPTPLEQLKETVAGNVKVHLSGNVTETFQNLIGKQRSANCRPCLYLTLMVVSLSFILTGLVIHNQGTLRLYNSIDNVNNYASDVHRRLSQLSRKATDAAACVVNKAMEVVAGQVSGNIQKAGNALAEQLQNRSNLLYSELANTQGLDRLMDAAHDQCLQFVLSLGTLYSKSVDSSCNRAIRDGRGAIDAVCEHLREHTQRTRITRQTQQSEEIHAVIVRHVEKFANGVHQAWASIGDALAGGGSPVESFFSKIDAITRDIAEKTKGLHSWSVYTTLKSHLSRSSAAPGIFALLLVFLAGILCFVRCSVGSHRKSTRSATTSTPPLHSFTRAHADFMPMIGFYVLLLFAFIAIAISCLEYLGILKITELCKHISQNKTLALYDSLEKGNASSTDLNVRISQLSSKDSLEKFVYPTIIQKTKELEISINKVLLHPKTAQIAELLENTGSRSMLDSCMSADENLRKHAEEEQKNFERSISRVVEALKHINESLITKINNATLDQHNSDVKMVADAIVPPTMSAIEKLVDDIASKTFSCRGLFTAYENFEKTLCSGVESSGSMLSIGGSSGIVFVPATMMGVLSVFSGVCSVSNLICLYMNYRRYFKRRGKLKKTNMSTTESL
ncbi:hypothetical protein Q1695_008671 [Nippostrongylus brasiliensis]|nr:hypothetical protein Q1695_008671 [Nippostrongylus brasiliensis]